MSFYKQFLYIPDQYINSRSIAIMPLSKSISVLTIAALVFMVITVYYRMTFTFLSAHLLITIAYLIMQCWKRQDGERLSQIILHGEAVTGVLYIVWVGVLQSQQYVFYLPMCVGMCGRVYDLVTRKDKRSESITQNYILLQGKIELFMLIYLTLVLSVNLLAMNTSTKGIVMYLLAILLFRLKYHLNYSFRTSISSIHLFYDKLSKRVKFRRCYQRLYKLVVMVFVVRDYYSGQKRLRY